MPFQECGRSRQDCFKSSFQRRHIVALTLDAVNVGHRSQRRRTFLENCCRATDRRLRYEADQAQQKEHDTGLIFPLGLSKRCGSSGARLSVTPPCQNIGSATTYGAYDTRRCYDAVATQGVRIVAPRARTPSRGNPQAQAPSLGTRPKCLKISGCYHLAAMERISSPKPRRNKDALCEAAEEKTHGEEL